jgi:phosphoribosylformylglycinamidine cyclo-ligase
MTTRKEGITYDQVVDYEQIDPFKISAQEAATSTAQNLDRFGYSELSVSRGESAFVWDEGAKYRAGVMEGLGTKNLIADKVDKLFPDKDSHYYAISQDNLAMIANDLAACGADPQLFWAHVAAGESSWFNDIKRVQALNIGTAAVCNEIGVTWAGGETPVLNGIIKENASELSGFMLGEIDPKEHYISGNSLEAGDTIVLVGSSGIHANGISAGRKLSDSLPNGYMTELPDGSTFGETLLTPTNLYVKLVRKLLDENVEIHRMENITGHGWRKLMRANQQYTYRIHDLPPNLPVFDFMQKHMHVSDAEMFGNYNMGAGYALYLPQNEADRSISICNDEGLDAWSLGKVEAGPKRVIIEPKNLVFSQESLAVRKKST